MKQGIQLIRARILSGIVLLMVLVAVYGLVGLFGTAVSPVQAQQPTVGFTSTSYAQQENVGSVNITVQLTNVTTPLSQDVTVEYLTVAGTATEGTGGDYIDTSGILTFTNTTTSLTFSVSLLDDTIDEPTETVNLILRNPSGLGTVLGTSTAVLSIQDNDPPPTATPTPTTGAPPVFSDAYEPNNTLPAAYTTASDAAALCNATLWPVGDEDYFRFSAKAGLRYKVFTWNLTAGLDTVLTIYNTQGVQIASNDDAGGVGNLASEAFFTADADGFYYARVTNKSPSDPTNLTYCFEIDSVAVPTPTPSQTPITGDICEFNSTIEYACEIGVGQTLNLNFVPVYGSLQDTDVFRLWMKPGILYTCETSNLSPVTDTNMIFLDANGNDFQPNLGNDDKAPGDYGSKLSILSTYTGWLHIMVGPVNPIPYEEAASHTYDLTCTSTAATPTPTPVPTSSFTGGTGGTGGSFLPTATPIVFPTFPPTPTPIDLSLFATPTPAPPPAVQFQPLPTATPSLGLEKPVSVNITLYYDTNVNFTPELNEGIMDVAVALYDNATGQLISFGYTNEAGMIRFDSVTAGGAVRVVVPFLNYSQVVLGDSENILLRVAPQPLPIGIP